MSFLTCVNVFTLHSPGPFLPYPVALYTQMAKESGEDAHQQQRARSYSNLDKAQTDAKRKNGYNWQQTRNELTSIFREHFGTDPYNWQLDVTEAILLGLDSVVIAGTGAGKTMPFMMPLLLDKKKRVIIISPLKVLQEDQVHNSLYFCYSELIWDHRLHGSRECRSQLRP
jgi:superfamily II DNA helicase RecQ